MANQFPAGANNFPRPDETKKLNTSGYELDLLLNDHSDAIEDDEAKIGYSETSAQDTPLADTGLFSDTNGKSKWQKAQTRHIATNAVTQSGFSTGSTNGVAGITSTSYFTLDGDGTGTELRVGLTTNGGDLICFLICSVLESVGGGNAAQLALSLDGAAEVGEVTHTSSNTNRTLQMVTMWRFTGVSAAAHVVRGRFKVGGSTWTVVARARHLLVVELKK